MHGYAQALADYERYLSEPPMSKEELEEEYNAKQDYLETMADYAYEEMRLNEW